MSSTSQRLAEAVLARREELELSQLEVAAAGGPSNTWLTMIENGRLERLSRVTAKKLDAGLQWEPGSARNIWNGGEPTPLIPGLLNPDNSAILRERILNAPLDEDEKRELLRLVDRITG